MAHEGRLPDARRDTPPVGYRVYIAKALETELGVRDRAQLVVIAYETGLVRPGTRAASS